LTKDLSIADFARESIRCRHKTSRIAPPAPPVARKVAASANFLILRNRFIYPGQNHQSPQGKMIVKCIQNEEAIMALGYEVEPYLRFDDDANNLLFRLRDELGADFEIADER
jgi:hypothetical protein